MISFMIGFHAPVTLQKCKARKVDRLEERMLKNVHNLKKMFLFKATGH